MNTPHVRLLLAASVAALAAAVIATARLTACTTFCMASGDGVLFGRNYDFDFGRGALIVNPRGLHKTGFADGGPTWTARHGSVTFNQFGRGFPMGGINEAGLVVELMWHEKRPIIPRPTNAARSACSNGFSSSSIRHRPLMT